MLTFPTAAGSFVTDWHSVSMEDSWFPSSLPPSSALLSPSPSHSPSTLSALAALTRGHRRRPGKLAAGDSLSPLTPHLYPRTPFCSPNSSPHPLHPSSPLQFPSSSPSASAHPHSTPPFTKRRAPSSSTLTITISPHSTRSHSMPYLNVSELFHNAGEATSTHDEDGVATPFSSPYPQALDAPLSPLLLSTSPISPSPLHHKHHNSPAGMPASPLLCYPLMSASAGSPLSAAFGYLPSSMCSSPSPSTEWSRRVDSSLCYDEGELHVPVVLKSPMGSPVLSAMTPHPSPAMGPMSLASQLSVPPVSPMPLHQSRSLLSSSSSLLYDQLSNFSIELQQLTLDSVSPSTEEEKKASGFSESHQHETTDLPLPRVIIRVTSADEQSSGSEVNSDSD